MAGDLAVGGAPKGFFILEYQMQYEILHGDCLAVLREGRRATGIELMNEHVAIIKGRVDHELFGDLL